jgi:hypothetical protein
MKFNNPKELLEFIRSEKRKDLKEKLRKLIRTEVNDKNISLFLEKHKSFLFGE